MSALIFDVAALATPAEDVRPGAVILGADGIRRTVRDVKYGVTSVRFIYTAGPSDGFRRSYLVDIVD